MEDQKQKLLKITSGESEQPFNWSAGRHGSKFLTTLRDEKKILGVKCPKCGFVYALPRQVCGKCFVKMEEMVELSDTGTLVTFTVVYFTFIDPDTGKQRPVPYGYGFIKLDGADNFFQHFIEETDPQKIKIGDRMQAVFEENRKGSLLDIKHFKKVS